MNSKQRVLTAFALREPDRVPINYMANPGIDARLKWWFDGLWGQRRRWMAHETGGDCFAPTHPLQDNSPVENVVAMYETARSWK
jgi:hypothetical protein